MGKIKESKGKFRFHGDVFELLFIHLNQPYRIIVKVLFHSLIILSIIFKTKKIRL